MPVKFLLTNDDGIDARGLETLADALAGLGEAIVVAPEEHLSGCSHQTTTDRPLRLTERDAGRRYSVSGSPADCTRLGLLHVAPDVDWVLSGVNHGGNLGVDVHMSGTVAAVREGVLLGRPGIAFSQYRRRRGDEGFDWSRTGRMLRNVLEVLLEQPPQAGRFWNVNFPDLSEAPESDGDPEVVFCPLETGHLPVAFELVDGHYHYRGQYGDRPRQDGSDVDVCFSGQVAVSRVPAHLV